MPDLEELIRTTLDRQAPRPDPDPIVERVARRKRQVRLARRVQSATLAVVVVAGIAAGGYALARAFGVGGKPAPASSATVPAPSASPSILACGGGATTLAIASQEGAAGTISTVWMVTNHGSTACRSIGYPAIDIHLPAGWTGLHVIHGGYPNINERPKELLVQPGQSLFFVSYWSDVTTNLGPCESFDRVSVTLPGSASSVELATSGSICPSPAHVGPVSASPPAG
jgi:hypothetical protein